MRAKRVPTALPAALSVMLVCISTQSAHAYLDAGTGSMILQLLLGGIAGLAIAGKLYWHKLLTLVGLRTEAPIAAEDNEGDLSQARTRTDR
jgi:hypothetical protein